MRRLVLRLLFTTHGFAGPAKIKWEKEQMKSIIKGYNSTSLILRIAIGLVIGAVLGLVAPHLPVIGLFGDLFVGALKAIAPILVFVLVISSLAQSHEGFDSRFATVIFLYMISTLAAAIVAVVGSFLFPQTLVLTADAAEQAAPSGIGEVLKNLLINMIANPVAAISEGKYIGILFWAVVLGLATKAASPTTKQALNDISDAVSKAVRWIINLAPFGICGIVFTNVSESGLAIFTTYGKLLGLLVGCMLFTALVVSPSIASITLKRNAWPLAIRCLKDIDPAWRDDQHGRCCHHDFHHDTGCCTYAGRSGRRSVGDRPVRALGAGSLRCIRRCRRIPPAYPDGVLDVRYFQ